MLLERFMTVFLIINFFLHEKLKLNQRLNKNYCILDFFSKIKSLSTFEIVKENIIKH